jgi:hypothetical protein
VTIVQMWPIAFDPIQVVLGISGVAALLVGLTIRASERRQQLGRRLLLLGLGLVGATVLYSLTITWAK